MGELEEEERYVQGASRFFRVKPRAGGANLHYLGSCFLCKESIACNRDVFMYKYAHASMGMASSSFRRFLPSVVPYLGANRSAACRGDAAFCSDDCRQEQMDMDEALQTVARRHRLLRAPPSSSSSPAADAAASRPPAMRRRPTIANLAARNPPVAAS
ncbi:hypothetical protein PVAP13_4KG376203 [Panicum virgatum]|uniref:FLZ-type domain-containing protein n=1 Tax=Panicum virgatum TaxID=38727 RepID=A0A8T0TY66_PANVG|nr:hypothetical protein PVAP13_4KG376203 [Panicum virgatum]